MSVVIKTFSSRDLWLENRKKYIGGSDVACIMGLNPWKTNIQLWQEKTGRAESDDISDNSLVRYGVNAEPLLRELFKLDYPQMRVEYKEYNTWLNSKYPYAAASLDGWMIDPDNRLGIFECKTATIKSAAQKAKWENNCIPDNYYCQVLFYMVVCEADFVILKAQLKYERDGEEPFIVTKHYPIERSEVESDIKILMDRTERFYRCIQEDKEPALLINF